MKLLVRGKIIRCAMNLYSFCLDMFGFFLGAFEEVSIAHSLALSLPLSVSLSLYDRCVIYDIPSRLSTLFILWTETST